MVVAQLQFVQARRRRTPLRSSRSRARAASRSRRAGTPSLPPWKRRPKVPLRTCADRPSPAARCSRRPTENSAVGRLTACLRHQVDRAADRVGVHVRRQRLRHLDRLQLIGRHRVERDAAHVAFGRRNALAVDHHRVQARLGAADQHVAALALVARDRHAGNARRRLGRVRIRESFRSDRPRRRW